MKRIILISDVYQNMSLLDRSLRTLISLAILIGTIISISLNDVLSTSITWHSFVIFLSIYPFLTGLLGWDPYYWMTRLKTCGLSDKNLCGTLPHQINAAIGRDLLPDYDYKANITNP